MIHCFIQCRNTPGCNHENFTFLWTIYSKQRNKLSYKCKAKHFVQWFLENECLLAICFWTLLQTFKHRKCNRHYYLPNPIIPVKRLRGFCYKIICKLCIFQSFILELVCTLKHETLSIFIYFGLAVFLLIHSVKLR